MGDPYLSGFRLIVCGTNTDALRMSETLDRIHMAKTITTIIHGGDPLAAEWADRNQIEAWSYPLESDSFGTTTPELRNAAMIASGKPAGVVAFAEYDENMIAQARLAGIKVMMVTPR